MLFPYFLAHIITVRDTNIKGGYIFKLRHRYMCKYVPMSQKRKKEK